MFHICLHLDLLRLLKGIGAIENFFFWMTNNISAAAYRIVLNVCLSIVQHVHIYLITIKSKFIIGGFFGVLPVIHRKWSLNRSEEGIIEQLRATLLYLGGFSRKRLLIVDRSETTNKNRFLLPLLILRQARRYGSSLLDSYIQSYMYSILQ